MDKNCTFRERLELGNSKEYYVNDILNLMGLSSDINNKENVTDMDLVLENNRIYIDVKYLESTFADSKERLDIDPCSCLIISKDHVKAYERKRKITKYNTWVCFLINFNKYNIYELRFIKTSEILNLINEEKAFVRFITDSNGYKKAVINLNRKDCLTTLEFLTHVNCQSKLSCTDVRR